MIWVDDAFGSIRHEPYLTQAWSSALPKLMAAVKKGTRVILTSRDYIYHEARPYLKETTYPLLREGAVVVDVGVLSSVEREKIVYNHVRLGSQATAVKGSIKPYLPAVASTEPFRPEIARRLANPLFTRALKIDRQNLIEFAAKQTEFLADLFSQLGDDHRAALVMVYFGNPLLSPLGVNSEAETLIRRLGSSHVRVAEALQYLTPSFLRYGKLPDTSWSQVGWEFRHPTLREGFARFISSHPDLLELYVSGLDDVQRLSWLDCGKARSLAHL